MPTQRVPATILLTILLLSSLASLCIDAGAQEVSLTVSSAQFSGFSIIEITIDDEDIKHEDADMPFVTINGTQIKMYQATDGTWFGYVRVWSWCDRDEDKTYDAGEPIVIDVNGNGVYDEGVDIVKEGSPNDGENLWGIMPENPPQQEEHLGAGEVLWDDNDMTSVTSVGADVDHGAELTVTYHKDAEQYEAHVVYDWFEGSISIDRDEYPPNAKAYITVEDQDLNQDPTKAETYTVDPITGAVLLHVDRTRAGVTQQDIYSGLQLVETGPNDGVFEAQQILSKNDFQIEDVAIFRYEDQHPDVTVKDSANIATHMGAVAFDQDSYRIGGTAEITLTDPDLNLDSRVAEQAEVKVWSDTDQNGFNLTLDETEVDSGEFTGNVSFILGNSEPQNRRLQVSSGDLVYVLYEDESDEVGLPADIVDTASIVSYTGTVSLDRDLYVPGAIVYITVWDPDENLDPEEAEVISYTEGKVTVESWWGGQRRDGPHRVTCIETGEDTSTFEGKVYLQFEAGEENEGIPRLQVKSGAIIKVKYYDELDEWGREKVILAEARFQTHTGTLSLNSDFYPPCCTLHPNTGGTVRIEVVDPDLNVNPNSVDIYEATDQVLSLDVKDSEGNSRPNYPIWLRLIETEADSGIFMAEHALSNVVERNDLVEVTYQDEYDESGNPRETKACARVLTHTGTLSVDKSETHLFTELTITVTDPDWNFDREKIDVIPPGNVGDWSGVDVWSTTTGEAGGLQIELTETDVDTGVFEATIIVGQTIQAAYGDTLTIRYNDEQDASGIGSRVKVEVAVKAYTGEVSLDKEVYSCNDVMTITVKDPDMNIDPEAVDYIPASRVQVKSSSWLQAVNPDGPLIETEADSGIFQGTFRLLLYTGQTGEPEDGTIYVYNGDGVVVTYLDPLNEEGEEDFPVTASAKVEFTTGTISFDKEYYVLEDKAVITVEDPDANKNPLALDVIEVSVFSEADPAGIRLTLIETSQDSGVFQASFNFTEDISHGSYLHVNPIDQIKARYVDETPNPSDVPNYEETGAIEPVKVEASVCFGAPPQPEMPLEISKPQLVDEEGNPLVSAELGEPVLVSTEVTNTGPRDQSFLYIVQIKDAEGKVVFLSFIQGVIPAGKSVPASILWTPQQFGTFTVEAYTWKSWENATPLSPGAQTTIQVAFKPH